MPTDTLTRRDVHTAQVAAAFDAVAGSFETALENDITRGIRLQLYALIESLVPPGASILDINCGIGIDAVELASKGYLVKGADISSEMLAHARLRAAKHQAQDIIFTQASFENLSPFQGNSFDLVFSNFGGLNCVPKLQAVAEQLAQATKLRGFVVAVVMPPVSLWEMVAGLARFNIRAGFRRFGHNIQATGFGTKSFNVSYYSPHAFASAFRNDFDVLSLRGLNILTPPPHATTFGARFKRLTRWLVRAEQFVASFPLFRALGDHYVIVLQRKDNRVTGA